MQTESIQLTHAWIADTKQREYVVVSNGRIYTIVLIKTVDRTERVRRMFDMRSVP